MTSRVDDGIFQKGKLYRVTLKMAVPILQNGAPWNNLALEDFYPGGWRPINSNLKTENSLTRSNLDDWWGYTESRDDRLLAHVDTGYSTKRVYTYFVRPERV